MASYSPSDVQNKVTQTAALGFRVKSGWTVVVLLTRLGDAPQLADVNRVELSDPRLPETRQPYHARIGKLETDSRVVSRRERVVRRIAQQSLGTLLTSYWQKGYRIRRAALVVGSQIDPAIIANPHIRAHAFEGQLFRSAIEQVLNAHDIRAAILLERDAYTRVAAGLKQSNEDLKRVIQDLGRSITALTGPWRAEQKLATLAALFALK
jgi:hypothetical protein